MLAVTDACCCELLIDVGLSAVLAERPSSVVADAEKSD